MRSRRDFLRASTLTRPARCMLPLDSLGRHVLVFPNLYRRRMEETAELLPGTLDLLILKALSLGAEHGYGVLLRIQQITAGALTVEQGALYPALYRLEHQGLLDTEWGTSDNNRKAKYYSLTAAGRRRFKQETQRWTRLAIAMSTALGTQEA